MEDVIYSTLTSRIILNIRSVGSEIGTKDLKTSEYTDTLTRSVAVLLDQDFPDESHAPQRGHVENIEMSVV